MAPPVDVRSASSVGAVGEATHQQRQVELLLRVTDGKHNLHVGVKWRLTQTLPVWTRLKAQLVHAGGESLSADESGAAAILIRCPDVQHVPDLQFAVEPVQAERQPGRRDAVAAVQHVSGQRAGLWRHHLDRCVWTGGLHLWDLQRRAPVSSSVREEDAPWWSAAVHVDSRAQRCFLSLQWFLSVKLVFHPDTGNNSKFLTKSYFKYFSHLCIWCF